MKSGNWKIVPALSALALATMFAPYAHAGCGLYRPVPHAASWQPQIGASHVVRVGIADRDEDDIDNAAIVGMWHVVFTAKTSNGTAIPDTVVDNALVQFHSDKTEIMNSVRPPQDGNFCLGTWDRTGRFTYYLNHFAWFNNEFPNNTNNGIGTPVGPTHITETINVSPDRLQFSGTFTLDAYRLDGTVFQSFTGVLTATRITTSTTTADLL